MKKDRVRWFALIAIILLSATIAYGAIPQNTIRQDAGIVMPTVNATAGYYVGTDQIVNAGLEASFNRILLDGVPVQRTLGDGELYCYIDGGRYIAVNRTAVLSNTTDPHTAISTALNFTTQDTAGIIRYNGLVNPRRFRFGVVRLGPGVWDISPKRLIIPVHTTLSGADYQTTINSSNPNAIISPMWSNFTYGVEVKNLVINGSGIPNTVRGFDWDQTTANNPTGELSSGALTIDRVGIFGCSFPVYAKTTSGLHGGIQINDVRAFGTIYWERIFDSSITDSGFGTLELNGACTSNTFANLYIAGGRNFNLWIHGGADRYSIYKTSFDNVRFDNPLQTHVIIEDFSETLMFTGCWFTNAHNAVNSTHSGITLGSNTHHISFTGCHFTNNQAGAAKPSTFKFLIHEQAGSVNNTYVGNNYEDNQYWGIPLFTRYANGSGLYNTWNVSNGSNFENRKRTYHAAMEANIGANNTEYIGPTGMSAPSTTSTVRSIYWKEDGDIANLRPSLSVAPGGATQWTVFTRLKNAANFLDVIITGAETYGKNASSTYFDVANGQGDYITFGITPGLGTPNSATRLSVSWDFYPRPEDVVGLRK